VTLLRKIDSRIRSRKSHNWNREYRRSSIDLQNPASIAALTMVERAFGFEKDLIFERALALRVQYKSIHAGARGVCNTVSVFLLHIAMK
jgi:hypothetical protein